MGLHSRPVFERQVESTVTGNHTGTSAVARVNWLPICKSIRSGTGWAEPEVYFRVVHPAQVGQITPFIAPSREQTAEVALGPNGVFEPLSAP